MKLIKNYFLRHKYCLVLAYEFKFHMVSGYSTPVQIQSGTREIFVLYIIIVMTYE